MMKYFISLVLIFSASLVYSGSDELKPFHLSDVKLLEGSFKHAMSMNREYIMALDPDRLLHPFLREAGLEPKAESYGNWESSGLDGHIGGHYLSSLALYYAASKDEEARNRLNYMLNELKRCQDAIGSGYIGGVPGGVEMWEEIAAGNIDAENFSLNSKWVPWYNIHKLYAGLYDATIHANSDLAKEMLIGLCDWTIELVSGLDTSQIQDMLRSEHGGMNEVFAGVAAITRDEKYMELAKKFSHQEILNPLLLNEDRLTGLHANTQIPKVVGFMSIASATNNAEWLNASRFFWSTVVNNRSISIGGNSIREHFHPADNFSEMITERQGPETCNTYNMLKLSMLLYLQEQDLDYINYYERALYNHILSSQHPSHGGLVYFTSMRPRHYRVYSQPETSFWCCVGSGIENHMKYGEMIYAHNNNNLFVNLFIASELNWKEKGVTLTQNSSFPEEESTSLVVQTEKPVSFGLNIRYPSWVKGSGMEILVNGEKYNFDDNPNSYITLNREWIDGDRVEVSLPMKTRLEQLPDGSPYYSILHGPIVLAAKTDTTDLVGLLADDSRMGHVAWGKQHTLQGAPLLVGDKDRILADISAINGEALSFNLPTDNIYPEEYNHIHLEPFYQIHDARYMVYWQIVDSDGFDDIMQAMAELEKDQLELEARTIDQVVTGEQQPEYEHSFKGHRTETGIHRNQLWRNAEGWFSYEMINNEMDAEVLRVTYHGLNSDRSFDILINDQVIATVTLDGGKGDVFYSLEYNIPVELRADRLVVEFKANEDSVTGDIYDVRLLRE